jgi:hypothetical protein
MNYCVTIIIRDQEFSSVKLLTNKLYQFEEKVEQQGTNKTFLIVTLSLQFKIN